jgi:flagellar motor switch protein FliM
MSTMDEILSQEEIEALLGDLPEPKTRSPGTTLRLVQDYDLTRPMRMSSSHVERLAQFHGALASPMSERLSRLLDRPVQADLASVEQMRVTGFLRTLPERTPAYVIGDPGSGIVGFLAVEPSFLFGAIDLMLGGSGEAEPAAREMTPTELALTEKFLMPVLVSLSEAWAEVHPVNFEILSRPGEPRPSEDLEGDMPVLSITFLLGGSGPTGAIRYCVSTPVLEPILAAGSSRKLLAAPEQIADPRVERTVRNVNVPLSVELGSARVPLKELTNLSPGDVIPLSRRTDEPLEISFGGIKKFRGHAGLRRGRYAVTISSRIEPEKKKKKKPQQQMKKKNQNQGPGRSPAEVKPDGR